MGKMSLIQMAQEILDIAQYMKQYKIFNSDEGKLCVFDQTWGSTALGFGGVGGSAMTTARTYVFMPDWSDNAYVFFGGRFAYKTQINERFKEDMKNHRMASVMESGRYNES